MKVYIAKCNFIFTHIHICLYTHTHTHTQRFENAYWDNKIDVFQIIRSLFSHSTNTYWAYTDTVSGTGDTYTGYTQGLKQWQSQNTWMHMLPHICVRVAQSRLWDKRMMEQNTFWNGVGDGSISAEIWLMWNLPHVSNRGELPRKN